MIIRIVVFELSEYRYAIPMADAQEFARGLPLGPLQRLGSTPNRRGTTVSFGAGRGGHAGDEGQQETGDAEEDRLHAEPLALEDEAHHVEEIRLVVDDQHGDR